MYNFTSAGKCFRKLATIFEPYSAQPRSEKVVTTPNVRAIARSAAREGRGGPIGRPHALEFLRPEIRVLDMAPVVEPRAAPGVVNDVRRGLADRRMAFQPVPRRLQSTDFLVLGPGHTVKV